MNLKNAAALIRDDITTVEVSYLDFDGEAKDKSYTYKCPLSVANMLSVGDLVIARSRHNYGIAQVREVHSSPAINPDFEYDYRWVFQRVMTEYHDMLENQDNAIADQLEKRKAQSYREQILSQLGLNDASEVQALIDEANRKS